jgi:sugar lactone lactonase YvrE
VLSNGLGWSPDARTQYFAETHSKRIYRYDYDKATGALGPRRVFATVEGEGGPDGLTVDAEGHVWVAIFGNGAIHRYRPDGILALSLELPFDHPTSCTFGGEDLRTLYITSSRLSIEGHAQRTPQAGGLWSVRLDVAGQPEERLGY